MQRITEGIALKRMSRTPFSFVLNIDRQVPIRGALHPLRFLLVPRPLEDVRFHVGQAGSLGRVGNPPGAPVANRRAA